LFPADVVEVFWQPNNEPDLGGYKVYYGTSSRQYSAVIDVGKNTRCTVQNLAEGIRYYFTVTAYDESGNESTFSQEVSTLIPNSDTGNDTMPPKVDSVKIVNPTAIRIVFSEIVEKASAENNYNYRISNGVDIIRAILSADAVTVLLLTTPHTQDEEYTLSISDVKDRATPPNIIASNSMLTYVFEDLQQQNQFTGVWNYPNPFEPNTSLTHIRYYLHQPTQVGIRIYDAKGELVKTLLNRTLKSQGEHIEDLWDGTNENGDQVGNGVYLCKVSIGDDFKVIKIAVVNL